MNRILLGLSGPARAGKDAFALALAQTGWWHDSFAAPLRTFVRELAGLPAAQFDALKDQPLALLDGVTPRRMMQTLGTEWGRELVHRELWLRACLARIEPAFSAGVPVVISDVRFENEAAVIRARGGYILHLRRPVVAAVEPHASEGGVQVQEQDMVLYNAGSLADWQATARAWARQLLHGRTFVARPGPPQAVA